MLAKTASPHHLPNFITDDYAHICAKAIAVNHMDSENFRNFNASIVSQSLRGSN
jgi:hypothetical protein